jgi:spermidine dehydrogenase
MPCATAPCRFRARSIREVYDLVIVGGGLSGLSAAHFYHKAMGAGQKVLVLDNHDDFGGHAKRNEFVVNGKTIVCNGGTLNIESPGRYNPWARSVLKTSASIWRVFAPPTAPTRHLYADFGLAGAYAFDRETFGKATGGKDMVVRLPKNISGASTPTSSTRLRSALRQRPRSIA